MITELYVYICCNNCPLYAQLSPCKFIFYLPQTFNFKLSSDYCKYIQISKFVSKFKVCLNRITAVIYRYVSNADVLSIVWIQVAYTVSPSCGRIYIANVFVFVLS